MDDRRYVISASDNPSKGDYMVVRETIRDFDNRVTRDRDFDPEYFHVYAAASARLDKLNEGLISG